MIDLYTWTTPNGRKISILLEELGINYKVYAIDIGKGEQHRTEFLKISPNNKIPAIFDHDTGQSVMESGAILLYLAQKYQKFIPSDTKRRTEVLEWLMWQVAGFGPILGQGHHFSHYNAGISDYAAERFKKEAERLYAVLDKRLDSRDYICNDYSIVDMACWPWASRFEWHKIDITAFPNVFNWYKRVGKRDAVQKGYHIPNHMGQIPGL